MAGFGSLPGDVRSGDAGVPVPPDPAEQQQQFSDDIHAIRKKYVDDATNVTIPISVAANAGVRQDMQGQMVNSIILTVQSGLVFGYLTDQSPNFGKAAFVPDFVCSAGIVPTSVQIMVPPRDDYILSFQEGGGSTAATGKARAMKL